MRTHAEAINAIGETMLMNINGNLISARFISLLTIFTILLSSAYLIEYELKLFTFENKVVTKLKRSLVDKEVLKYQLF